MKMTEYCGNFEHSILQFIFHLTNDIREKIQQKKLFYREQIVRYAEKQLDFFFKAYHLKSAILNAYKQEAYNTMMFKLKNILKENNIFQCV
ncbi:hypothetical protein ACFOU2_10905 [Bacillus songklensis]|uniref:Uncharacterized protein n=1 Tax=Bacillus songklensis TaxID=1069116 RepID=A0ABV8B114_9BACI